MKKAVIFYNEKMNVLKNLSEKDYSKSRQKPKLFLEYLEKNDLLKSFTVNSDWAPFAVENFYVAHSKEYVDSFFGGKDNWLKNSSFFRWSEEYAESIKYTCASLYHSILNSVNNREVSVSPTSGFHHAKPEHGSEFCAMSGQVISSLKLYREYGLRGVYVDLDLHFGNSIEDSYDFCGNDLREAIVANINPDGKDKYEYVKNLMKELLKLDVSRVNYIVLCHGADSHKDDDMSGGVLDTEYWLNAGQCVVDYTKHYNIPLSVSLFGGYRHDNFDFVLDLHARSVINCI